MNLLITGGPGLVNSRLSAVLTPAGHPLKRVGAARGRPAAPPTRFRGALAPQPARGSWCLNCAALNS